MLSHTTSSWRSPRTQEPSYNHSAMQRNNYTPRGNQNSTFRSVKRIYPRPEPCFSVHDSYQDIEQTEWASQVRHKQMEIEDLKTRLRNSESHRAQAEERLGMERYEWGKERKRLKDARNQLQHVETTNVDLMNEMWNMEFNLQRIQSDLQISKSALDDKNKQAGDKEKGYLTEICELKKELQKTINDQREVQKALHKEINQSKMLSINLQERERELQILKEEKQEQKAQKRTLLTKFQEKDEEIARCKRSVQDMQRKTATENEERNQHISQLRRDLEQSKCSLKIMKITHSAEKNELKHKLDVVTKRNCVLEEIYSHVNFLPVRTTKSDKVISLRKEITALQNALKVKKKEVVELEESNRSLQEQCVAVQRNSEHWEIEVNILTEKSKAQEGELSDLELSHQVVIEELETQIKTEKAKRELMMVGEDAASTIDKLQIEKETANKNLTAYELSKCKQQLAELNDELKRSKEDAHQKDKELECEHKRYHQLEEIANKLEQKCSAMERDLQQHILQQTMNRESMNRMEQENKTLQESIQDLRQTQRKSVNEEVAQLREKLSKEQDEYQAKKVDYDDLRVKYEEVKGQNESLQGDNEKLKKSVKYYVAEVEKFQGSNAKLEEFVQKLEKDRSDLFAAKEIADIVSKETQFKMNEYKNLAEEYSDRQEKVDSEKKESILKAQNDLQQARTIIHNLEKELESVKAQLARQEQMTESEVSGYNQQIAELEDQLQRSKENAHQNDTELESEHKRCQGLEQMVRDLENKLSGMEKDRQQLQLQHTQGLKRLDQENKTLQDSIHDLRQTQGKSVNEEIAQLREKLSKEQDKYETKNVDWNNLHARYEEIMGQNEKLKQEVNSYMAKVEKVQGSNAKLEELVQKLQKERSDLFAGKEIAEKALMETKIKMTEYKKIAKEYLDREKKVDSEKKEVSGYNQQIAELEDQLQRSQEDAQHKDKVLESEHKRCCGLEQMVRDLQNKCSAMEQDLQQYQLQHTQNCECINRLEQENKTLQESMQELRQSQWKSVNEEVVQLREKLSKERDQYQVKNVDYKELQARFEEVSGQNDILQEDNEKLKTSVKYNMGEVETVQGSNAKLTAIVGKLEKDRSDLFAAKEIADIVSKETQFKMNEYKNLAEEYSDRQEKVDSEKKESILKAQNDLQQARTIIHNLEKELESVKAQLARQEQMTESEVSGYNQQIAELEDQLQRSKENAHQNDTELESEHKRCQGLEQMVRDLENKLSGMEKDRQQLQLQHTQGLKRLDQENKTLQDSIHDLRQTQGKSVNEEIAQLREKLSKEQDKYETKNVDWNNLHARYEEVMGQNEKLKQEVNSYMAKVEKVQGSNAKLEELVQKLQKERSDLFAGKEIAEKALMETKIKMTEYKKIAKEYLDREKKVDSEKKEVSGYNQQIAELEDQLQRSQEDAQHKDKVLESEHKRCCGLEQMVRDLENKCSAMEQDLQQYQLQHTQNCECINRLEQENKTLQESMQELRQSQWKSVNEEVVQLREKLSKERDQYQVKNVDYKELQARFEEVSGQNDILQEDNEKLKTSVKYNMGEVETVQGSNAKLTAIVGKLEKERSDLFAGKEKAEMAENQREIQINEQIIQIKQLQKDNQELQHSCWSLRNQTNKTQEEQRREFEKVNIEKNHISGELLQAEKNLADVEQKMTSLNKDCYYWQHQYEEVTHKSTTLEKDHSLMKEQHERLNVEVQTKRKSSATKDRVIAGLEESLAKRDVEIQNLKHQHTDEVRRLQAVNEDLAGRVRTLQQEIETNLNEVKQLEAKLVHVEQREKDLRGDNDSLQMKLELSNSEKAELVDKVKRTSEEAEGMRGELKLKSDEAQKYQAAFMTNEQVLETQCRELDSMKETCQSVSDDLKVSQKEKSYSQNKLIVVTRKLEESETELRSLNSLLTEGDRKLEEVKALAEQWQQKCAEVDKQRIETARKYERLREQHRSLEQEINDMRKQLRKSESTVEKLTNALSRLKLERDMGEKKQKQDLNVLKGNLKRKEEELEKCAREKKYEYEKAESFKEQLEELKTKVKVCKERDTEVKKAMEELKEKFMEDEANWKDSLERTESELEKVKQEQWYLVQEVQTLKENKDISNEELQQTKYLAQKQQNKIEQLKKENAALSKNQQKHHQTEADFLRNVQDLQQKINSYERELRKVKQGSESKDIEIQQLQRQITDIKRTGKGKEEEIHDLMQDLKRKEKALSEKEEVISKLQATLSINEQKHRQTESETSQSVCDLQDRINSQERELLKVTQEIRSKDTEIEKLQKIETGEERRVEDKANKVLLEKENMIGKLQESVDDLQAKINMFEKELKKVKQETHTKDIEIEKLQRKVADVRKRGEGKDKEIYDLMKDLERSRKLSSEKDDSISHLREELKRKSKDVEQLQKKLQEQIHEISKLHERIEKTKRQDHGQAVIPKVTEKEGTKDKQKHEDLICVVPSVLYEDERVHRILPQFLARVGSGDASIVLQSVPSISILPEHHVIVPCIAASRVGSDITAALGKAKLPVGIKAAVLIFHHLAPHNCRISVATRDRLHDRSLVDASDIMLDLVFWNSNMYDCPQNTTALQQINNYYFPHVSQGIAHGAAKFVPVEAATTPAMVPEGAERDQQHENTIFIIPSELDADHRIKTVMERFTEKMESSGITVAFRIRSGQVLKPGDNVVLPVIAASRLGSDIEAAFTSSKLQVSVKVTMLIFHHLAKHNCRIAVPTRDKLHDRSIVGRCNHIVDVVFWNGEIYTCAANTKAIKQLTQIFNP